MGGQTKEVGHHEDVHQVLGVFFTHAKLHESPLAQGFELHF